MVNLNYLNFFSIVLMLFHQPFTISQADAAEKYLLTQEKLFEKVKTHPSKAILLEKLKERALSIEKSKLYPTPVFEAEAGGLVLENSSKLKMVGGIGINYPFKFFLEKKHISRLEEVEKELSEIEGKIALSELLLELKIYYLEAAFYFKESKWLEELCKIYEDFFIVLEKKVKNREVREADLFRFMIEKDKLKIELEESKAKFSGRVSQLLLIIGEKPPGVIELEEIGEKIELLETKAILKEKLLKENPELQLSDKLISKAKAEIKLTETRKISEISGGPYLKKEAEGLSTGLALEITFPALHANSLELERGKCVLKQLELAKSLRVLNLLSVLEELYSEASKLKEKLSTFSNAIIPNAEKSSKLLEILYFAGEESFLSFLESKRNYKEIILEHLEMLSRYKATLLKINRLTGAPYVD